MSIYKQIFLAIGASLLAAAAAAEPITFTFSGVGDVSTIGASTTLGTNFTFVFTADTSAIVPEVGPPAYFRLYDLSGTFTDGSFQATVSPVLLVENQTAGNIAFYNSLSTLGLGLTDTSAISGYALASSIGPLSSNGSTITLLNTLNGGSFAVTGSNGPGGITGLTFTSDSSLTFSSAVSAVPEPGTYALLATGLLLLGWKIRAKPQGRQS
jgi:hypothetical protein